MRLLVFLLALVAPGVWIPCAWADDVGVTRVELIERADGGIVMLVRAPATLVRAFGAPQLQDGSRFTSDGFVPTPGGGAALRYTFADRPLVASDVIHLPWQRQGVMLVARFRDGTSVQRLFVRSGVGIDVPVTALRSTATSVWQRARASVLDGIRHIVTGLLHLAFVFALCLSALGRRGLRFAGHLLVGQVIGLATVSLAGTSLPVPAGELGLALATALLGASAFDPRRGTRLDVVLFLAGICHGAGLSATCGAGLGEVLGMDAVVLVGVGVVWAIVRSPQRVHRVRRALTVALGALSLALVLLWLWQSPRATMLDAHLVQPGSGPPSEALPGGAMDDRGTVSSAPTAGVASPLPSAPLQTFVVVEPYEVRHEILARVKDLSPWVDGLTDAPEIPVAAQADLKARIGALFRDREAVTIDGEPAVPAQVRVDFVTVGPKGTLPRTEPVLESLEDAFVGIVFTFTTGPIPGTLTLDWQFFDPVADDVPAAVTDPERTRRQLLVRSARRLEWTNELMFDPVPHILAIGVDPVTWTLPVVAIPFFVLAAFLVGRGFRRRRSWMVAGARLALTAGLLAAPLGELAVRVPFVDHPTPVEREAKQIVQGLLANVYRAFVFRTEDAIYDRLAVSVSGDQLAAVYLDSRRGLEIAARGGARARVESVVVESVEDIESIEGGFDAEFTWTVAGSVSHFGHRHFRQNRYRARMGVRAVGGTWKIVGIEVLDESRVL